MFAVHSKQWFETGIGGNDRWPRNFYFNQRVLSIPSSGIGMDLLCGRRCFGDGPTLAFRSRVVSGTASPVLLGNTSGRRAQASSTSASSGGRSARRAAVSDASSCSTPTRIGRAASSGRPSSSSNSRCIRRCFSFRISGVSYSTVRVQYSDIRV